MRSVESARLNKLPAWVWLVPIILLAAGLAFTVINHNLLWLDEVVTRMIIGGGKFPDRSPSDMLLSVSTDDAWPPLYAVEMYVWGNLAGWSDFATRTLLLLNGVLAVAMIYRLAKTMASERAGLLAALMLATCSFFLNYMHEVRGYSMYVLMTAFGVWMYLKISNYLTRHHYHSISALNRRLLLFGLTGLLYVHYVAAGVFAGLFLYHVLFKRGTSGFGWMLRQFIIAGALYLPWVLVMIAAVLNETRLPRAVTQPVIPVSIYGFSNGMPLLLGLALAYALVFLRGRVLFFTIFWTIIALIMAVLVDKAVDFLFHLRHIIFLLLPFITITAMSLAHLSRRIPAAVLLVLIWVVPGILQSQSQDFMLTLPKHVRKAPADLLTMVESHQNCLTGSEAIAFAIDKSPQDELLHERELNYYFSDIFPRYATVTGLRSITDEVYSQMVLPEGTYAERTQMFLDNSSAVWLFRDNAIPVTGEEKEFTAQLPARYPYCTLLAETPDVRLYVYSQDETMKCGEQVITIPACPAAGLSQ